MIKYAKTKKYYAPQNDDKEHRCDFPGCNKPGEYRAPKNRGLKEYYWFCLEHVQAYNAKWNYYEGEDDEEAAAAAEEEKKKKEEARRKKKEGPSWFEKTFNKISNEIFSDDDMK